MSLKGKFPAAVLSVLAVSILSCGLYFIFDKFLSVTGSEIVKAWYYGEIVNLQEGQVLPAIVKNQNLFEKSPFIRAIVLVDPKIPGRNLFSVGELSKPISARILNLAQQNKEMITDLREGFLSYVIVAKLPGRNGLFIVYEIWSQFLIWSFWAIVGIIIVFVMYLVGITIRVTNFERKKREDLRTDLLRRLAHDVNSPLLAISGLSLRVKKIDQGLHVGIEQATESIRQLFAQTDKMDKKLLGEQKTSVAAIDEDVESVPLVATLMEFVTQKRGEYSSEENLEITFSATEESTTKFVKINFDEFKRHLANLLKNSVEATKDQLIEKIEINVSSDSDLKIEIVDSGKGVPKDLLPHLGKKGFSFGKAQGKGLGLHFLMESIKHWRGHIEIESTLNVGTKILIVLPICEAPVWFKNDLRASLKKKLVIVDDDQSVLGRWQARFQLKDSNHHYFGTASDFRRWYNSGGQFEDDLLFAFDYHLEGQNTGLSLVNEFGLAKESVLVTSAYMDPEIINEAQQLSVKVFPKALI